MPLPFLALLAGASAFAPTAMNIGSKIGKQLNKSARSKIGGSLIQASAFGLGYGAFTNIGYNTSNRFITPGLRSSFKQHNPFKISMSYYPRRTRRYSRYPARRSTYSRYRRYTPRYRRSYY